MSILKRYINEGKVLIFCDFRSGSIQDKINSISTTQNGTLLSNSGLLFDGSARLNMNSLDIGLSDFTILGQINFKARKDQTMGLLGYNASNFPLFYTTALQLRAYISGTTFSSGSHSGDFLSKEKTVGYTADRDGDITFFEDGTSIGSTDFSSKAAVNINYAMALGSFFAASNNTPFYGNFYYFLVIKQALTDTEIAQLTSELNRLPDQRVDSQAFSYNPSTKVYTPTVYFKGEMHALANERTISSGQLENTPFEISSGSFKLITENVNGYECRVIECVTNGSLYLRTNYSSTTGWNRFVNTGSGYAETSAALGTANTFPLTSPGDKIVYASKDPKQSLYNKA